MSAVEEQLAGCRLQLQQALDERDALRHELEFYQSWFRGLDLTTKHSDAAWLAQSWINALGNKLIPKAHLIDALVLTTRKLRGL